MVVWVNCWYLAMYKQKFEPCGSTFMWNFFNKYLYYFQSTVGSLQVWRADCIYWSTPFYTGNWASPDYDIHQGLKTNPPRILRDKLSFWESKVICRFLNAWVVQASTVIDIGICEDYRNCFFTISDCRHVKIVLIRM